MKKKIKIIPICMLLIFMFSFAFSLNKNNVTEIEASDVQGGDCSTLEGTDEGFCTDTAGGYIDENYNYVKITKAGDITVHYVYGISEILIRVSKLMSLPGGVPNFIVGPSLGQGDVKEVYVPQLHIFASGEKLTQEETLNGGRTKVIHLSNYFSKGETLLVEMIYTFQYGEGYSDNLLDPIYCNLTYGNPLNMKNPKGPCHDLYVSATGDAGYKGEVSYNTYNSNNYSAYARVKALYATESNIADVKLLDNNHLVYSVEGSGGASEKFPASADAEIYTLVTIDNKDAQKDASEGVDNIIYDTVIPVLLTILGIAATVTVVVLGYQIIKSSDEPQERSQKIKHLRSILIGLVIAFIMLAALEPLVNFIQRWLE